VRYVLEGSVQRRGDRMRVNVQLVDVQGGAHLWAERFDKPVADLFDMQDEIVARLANQLQAELVVAEAHRSKKSPDPDSMDLYFQSAGDPLSRRYTDILATADALCERASNGFPECPRPRRGHLYRGRRELHERGPTVLVDGC
jgi:hypothetical protein